MRWYGVLVAVLAASVAGCGGGSSAPKAGTSEAALEAAVRAYSDAIVGGDGAKAFQLESERCQQIVDVGAAGAQAAQVLANYPGAKVKSIKVDDLSGTKAHVSWSYGGAAPGQAKKAWLKESTGWHWDAC